MLVLTCFKTEKNSFKAAESLKLCVIVDKTSFLLAHNLRATNITKAIRQNHTNPEIPEYTSGSRILVTLPHGTRVR